MKRSTKYFILRTAVLVAFVILAGRLWYMQIVQVNFYRVQAASSRAIYRTVQAPRGIIYDRNGVPLVRNVPSFDVTVVPDEWPTAGAVSESRRLSRLLGWHPSAQRIRWLIWSARWQPTEPTPIKSNVPLYTYWAVRAEGEFLPGVHAIQSYTRHYRDQAPWSLSHILGYVTPITAPEAKLDVGPQSPWANQHYTMLDMTGQSGVEALFEHQLHGINGIQSAQVNAYGQQVSPWKTVQAPTPGNGVRLTIDARFQEQAAADLQEGLSHIGLRQGAAVVMNPRTGEILAMVSLPSFNANIFSAPAGAWRARQIAAIERDPLSPQFNVAISAEEAPGSIYKIITATAGLEEGVITPQTVVDDTGLLQLCPACQPFHGWNAAGLGPVNTYQAIAESSDIFFYQVAGGGPDIANGLGPYRLGKWAKLFGLGRPTGIELPGEAAGLVPTPHELWLTQHHRLWSYGDSYNMGIGQGDNEVTPLQMANMVSAIANGGSLMRPHIVAAETGPNGKTTLPGKNFTLVPDAIRPHFISRQVVNVVRAGMRLGVTGDPNTLYATSLGEIDPRLQAAGKTGTAEVGSLPPTAWWVGFAPWNTGSMRGKPQIAVCVNVPRANGEGAYVAAPIANKIMLDYFHLSSSPTWVDNIQQKITNGLGM